MFGDTASGIRLYTLAGYALIQYDYIMFGFVTCDLFDLLFGRTIYAEAFPDLFIFTDVSLGHGWICDR